MRRRPPSVGEGGLLSRVVPPPSPPHSDGSLKLLAVVSDRVISTSQKEDQHVPTLALLYRHPDTKKTMCRWAVRLQADQLERDGFVDTAKSFSQLESR